MQRYFIGRFEDVLKYACYPSWLLASWQPGQLWRPNERGREKAWLRQSHVEGIVFCAEAGQDGRSIFCPCSACLIVPLLS